jgi:hypothetical protein
MLAAALQRAVVAVWVLRNPGAHHARRAGA